MPCYLGHPAGCHGLVSTPVLVPHHDALVVLDDKLVVLDRLASRVVAVGAAKVEEVVIEEREHVLGEVSCLDGDRGKARRPQGAYAIRAGREIGQRRRVRGRGAHWP